MRKKKEQEITATASHNKIKKVYNRKKKKGRGKKTKKRTVKKKWRQVNHAD